MSEDFTAAAAWVASQPNLNLSNEIKLELYALYKITTTGSLKPTQSRPGMFDFAGKAKHDTWTSRGIQLEQAPDAEELYISKVRSLGWEEGKEPSGPMLSGGGKGMVRVSVMQDEADVQSTGSTHDLATDGDLEGLRAAPNLSASINVKDDYGYTPLHLAADRGHAHVVSFLLAHGADASIKDNDGQTALDLAKCMDHNEIISLLQTQ